MDEPGAMVYSWRVPAPANEQAPLPASVATSGGGRPGAIQFAVVLGLLIFAAFPQVLLGLQTFVVRDYGFFAYPLAHYQRECFWRGEVPLWNPLNNCGVPFLAQWNTMPLYPPALIYLVLPLPWSLSFFCLAHVFLAGMGMYFLARRWTGSSLAAAVAGLIFAFNGLSLNFLMWPSHIATLSWTPWVLFFVQNAWRAGGRAIVLAALAGALQMLAGGPETILFTWLFLAALWLVETLSNRSGTAGSPAISPPPAAWRSALRFVLTVLLVAGLAAAQLLPFLDLTTHSERGSGYADARWSMPAWGWASFLVPMLHGAISNMGVFFQNGQGWTSSYYLGVGTVLLALFAVLRSRRRVVWLLGAATGVSLIMALGEHSIVYRAVRHVLPQVSMMTYPVKFVLLAVFCVPLLAAFGVAEIERVPASGEKSVRPTLLGVAGALGLLIVAIVIVAWRFPDSSGDYRITLKNGIVRLAFLILIAGVFCAGRQIAGKNLARHLPWVLLPVLWLDIITHEPSQNPTVPGWVYAPNLARAKLAMNPQPALGESRAMVSPPAQTKFLHFTSSEPADNLVANRLGYFADCNVLDGVPKVDGFFSLYPGALGDLVTTLYATNVNYAPVADFMGVSQITAPGQFFEWTNRDTFLPFVTAGQKPVYADGPRALYALFDASFDPGRQVILPGDCRAGTAVTNRSDGHAKLTGISSREVRIEAEGGEPFFVTLSQTHYHNWRAYVDERPVPLLRANYAFQAVELPAGKHHLRVAYEDRAFHTGCVVSLAAIVACAGIAMIGGRRKRDGVSGPV